MSFIAISAAVATATLIATMLSGHTRFAPGACERLEPYLLANIVGQDLAIRQFCDAVCDHLTEEHPLKPLVLSVHGPPGVGKSMMHMLAAQALYNRDPSPKVQCPGRDCAGYKVLYGLDYTVENRAEQHRLVAKAVIDHVKKTPQSLLVVEEYDKMDCQTRGLFKQLLDSSHSTNASMERSIVVFESNAGYMQVHAMLEAAGDRSKVQPEAAQKLLKDLVFELWRRDGCEQYTDTVKLVSLVDFYLPFLPLERSHIEELFRMRLQERAEELKRSRGDEMEWDEAIIPFLADKVDFEGRYPIEGAKEVGTLMTRYVTRALREHLQQVDRAREQSEIENGEWRKKWPPERIGIVVCSNGRALCVKPVAVPPLSSTA